MVNINLIKQGLVDDDVSYDREQAEYRAIMAYQNLQEKDPENELLNLATITTSGWWIFKKTHLELSPEHSEEYDRRYASHEGRYPIPAETYASDLRNALRE